MGLGRRPVLIAKWWGDCVSELPHQRGLSVPKLIIEGPLRLTENVSSGISTIAIPFDPRQHALQLTEIVSAVPRQPQDVHNDVTSPPSAEAKRSEHQQIQSWPGHLRDWMNHLLRK